MDELIAAHAAIANRRLVAADSCHAVHPREDQVDICLCGLDNFAVAHESTELCERNVFWLHRSRLEEHVETIRKLDRPQMGAPCLDEVVPQLLLVDSGALAR